MSSSTEENARALGAARKEYLLNVNETNSVETIVFLRFERRVAVNFLWFDVFCSFVKIELKQSRFK